jgi:ubiquinol oxidase
MRDDQGWVRELLDEAENERMHLMIFLDIAKPTWIERTLVVFGQGAFLVVYAFLYLISSKTAHRVVGYFEEEACKSYSDYLDKIDQGEVENVSAPGIAIDYYKLADDATLRDVILRIREDEADHRDRNHEFANSFESGALPPHQK